MAQLTSPFISSSYGWSYGESGWNTGMDENILKFSFLFDRNVDSVVSSLPAAVNGNSYFLTTDNRLYFAVNNTFYSSPTPKWFIFVIKSTGVTYQFNGTTLNVVQNNAELSTRLDAVELNLTQLGTAAYQPVSYFATPSQLDVVAAQAATYTDTSVSSRVLSSDLLNSSNLTKGISLVGGGIRQVASYTALRAYTGPGTTLLVSGRSSTSDGLGGVFNVISGDTTSLDDDGVTLVSSDGRRWRRNFQGRVLASWYGVVANDLTTSYSVQCQKAIDTGCNFYGGVDFPFGQIRVDASLVFPNKAYDIVGATGTGTEFVTAVTGLKIFDFTSANGPAKSVQRIGFSKLGGGAYSQVVGIWTNNTNGLLLDGVWARGIEKGLRYHGSFINLRNCAFEFCLWGVYCETACIESAWSCNTFYSNENADVVLTGNNATFSSVGSNHIRTRIEGWLLTNCNNAKISQVSFADDGSGFTPDLIHISGTSSGNVISQMLSSNFGRYGIYLEGANCVKNRFLDIVLRNTPVSGNKGVYSISATENYVEGLIEGYEFGVHINTSILEVKGSINGCTTGINLNAANYSVFDVKLSGNTTSDVASTSTTIIYTKSFDGNPAGLSGIPYILTKKGINDVVSVTAIPTALTWKVGDRAEQRVSVAGAASTWRCVTAGTPGTWKIESTLAA